METFTGVVSRWFPPFVLKICRDVGFFFSVHESKMCSDRRYLVLQTELDLTLEDFILQWCVAMRCDG